MVALEVADVTVQGPSSLNLPFPVPALPSNNSISRVMHQLARHGNYHNYYFHRVPTIPDPRLSLLHSFSPDLFKGKRVLDLGCNAGKLTMEVVQHLGAASAKGVDIDPSLIDDAKAIAAAAGGIEACEFICENFMEEGYDFNSSGVNDVIFLFSITKWLHLNSGDAGLKALFQSLHDSLPPQGLLIVEPQEWDNYKRAVKKNTDLKPVFKGIQMRPPFKEELCSVGFVCEGEIEREEGGFSRPLLLWRKGGVP